jgi:outer membrane protein OmpA-like peptidoglycan-associated protein
MNNLLSRTTFRVVLACAVVLLVVDVASAQTQVQGLITGRSGATMTIKTPDNETITVALTPETQVQEVQGALKMRKKELGVTALIPGLSVQVKGTMNGQQQLVADTVKFKGSDLKTAQDIQAGLAPTQQEVQANQAAIQANQTQIQANEKVSEAHQQEIAASQAKIAANQAEIAAANKRFGELGEYNIMGEVTLYFSNGKVDLDPKYDQQLLDLATKAQTITAYIVQVQGYASAVGSAALNQKLSMERANNVLAFLEQHGKIPLTNILAPGAMGTSDQVALNATTEGQAENRRVVVRILQNKGIAGS